MASIPPFPAGLRTVNLPRISLAKLEQSDELESARLFKACLDFGCFKLDFRDVEDADKFQTDVDHAFSVGKEFFNSPVEAKIKYPLVESSVGYKPPGTFKVGGGGTDNMEYYSFKKDLLTDASEDDLAPPFLLRRDFFQNLITTRLQPVVIMILNSIATHLEIGSSLNDLHDEASPSRTIVRFLHYPPAAEGSLTADNKPKLLGHTDNGSVTILFTALGGLQILPPGVEEHDSSAWEWVEPEPGCAFVNIGDSLVQWTGGLVRAVFHRVICPPGDQAACDRYSFGYFLKPANTASMRRLKGGLIPLDDDGEGQGDSHEAWHSRKVQNIYQGFNGVSRGGTATLQWKNRHLVEVNP